MLNPEYHVGEYRSADGAWHTSRFCDEIEGPIVAGTTETKLAERKPLVLIPVPNESEWVQAFHASAAAATLNDGDIIINTAGGAVSKRQREDETDDVSMSVVESDTMGAGERDTAATKARVGGDKAGDANAAVAAAAAAEAVAGEDLPEGSAMVYVSVSMCLRMC
jgi:Mini-chromosome maintenance replisome factor